jgi:hypothetical protein
MAKSFYRQYKEEDVFPDIFMKASLFENGYEVQWAS